MTALFVVMCLLCLGYGTFLLLAKDAAWRYTEWSNSLRGLKSERTGRWEANTAVLGVAWVILSCVFLLRADMASHPAQAPAPPPASNVSGLTIDGHPATPEQEREFEWQMNAQASGAPTRARGN